MLSAVSSKREPELSLMYDIPRLLIAYSLGSTYFSCSFCCVFLLFVHGGQAACFWFAFFAHFFHIDPQDNCGCEILRTLNDDDDDNDNAEFTTCTDFTKMKQRPITRYGINYSAMDTQLGQTDRAQFTRLPCCWVWTLKYGYILTISDNIAIWG